MPPGRRHLLGLVADSVSDSKWIAVPPGRRHLLGLVADSVSNWSGREARLLQATGCDLRLKMDCRPARQAALRNADCGMQKHAHLSFIPQSCPFQKTHTLVSIAVRLDPTSVLPEALR